MRNRKMDCPTIKVKNIGAYLDEIREMKNRHYVIMPNGTDFFCVNNEMIPAVNMPSYMPELQKKSIDKGKNLDSRTNWVD